MQDNEKQPGFMSEMIGPRASERTAILRQTIEDKAKEIRPGQFGVNPAFIRLSR